MAKKETLVPENIMGTETPIAPPKTDPAAPADLSAILKSIDDGFEKLKPKKEIQATQTEVDFEPVKKVIADGFKQIEELIKPKQIAAPPAPPKEYQACEELWPF